jgi:hypothetical protein
VIGFMEVNMSTAFSWQEAYHVAMLETDNRVLELRIQDAEAAIDERVRHLDPSSPAHLREQEAILDAYHALATLRRELSRAASA